MRLEYLCRCGWNNGPWKAEECWAWLPCPDCNSLVRVAPIKNDLMGDSPTNFIPDVPEHYSVGLGRKIRSRRHLMQVYKETGTQDFEPVRRPSSEFRGDPSRSLPYRL